MREALLVFCTKKYIKKEISLSYKLVFTIQLTSGNERERAGEVLYAILPLPYPAATFWTCRVLLGRHLLMHLSSAFHTLRWDIPRRLRGCICLLCGDGRWLLM